MKHQDTIPFPDELNHLDYTLRIIDTALTKAREDVLRIDQEYRGAKRYMAEYRNEMDRHEKLIFDWRAPVSGIFYDYETGRAGFEAPVGRIEGELTRKRQFKIQNGTMEYAIESSANVQDEILQKELAHTSDEKMKSMISTIQREQNVIIRNERADTLMIQGVAGSGKTSIALHRIAFLLYRLKNQITAEDVMILSEAWAKRAKYKSNLAFVEIMDQYISNISERVFSAKDYTYQGHVVPAAWIKERFHSYQKMPVKKRLASLAGDVREFLCSLMGKWEEVPKANVILKSLNKMLMIRDTLALYQDFYQYTDKKDMFVLSEKNTLEWEDVFPFLYLMAAFEGIEENRSVKHLVIDEMQDYTPIQFAVLNMMYPCQKTILGDFGQVLNPCHLHSLDEIRRIYKDAEFVALNKSYRSTYEIMEFAKKVCDQPSLEMVERHGERPRSISCENVDQESASITALIKQFGEGENVSLGIIVKTSADAKRLYDTLSEEYTVHLFSKDSTRFTNGVSIASIRMAKGLEFDEVIVPDADDRNYHSDYDRNLLYIACTRAMHKLTLFYTGRPSPFLPKQDAKIR